jgi:hypothetical protein
MISTDLASYLVRDRLMGTCGGRGTGRSAQYIEQNNRVRNRGFRVRGCLSDVQTGGIHDGDSKKNGHQSRRIAFFGSQERGVAFLSESVEEFEVRNLQRVLPQFFPYFTKSATLFAALLATLGLSGCLVAGYSSGRGWFVWPGSLGILVIVLVIVLLMRRR